MFFTCLRSNVLQAGASDTSAQKRSEESVQPGGGREGKASKPSKGVKSVAEQGGGVNATERIQHNGLPEQVKQEIKPDEHSRQAVQSPVNVSSKL